MYSVNDGKSLVRTFSQENGLGEVTIELPWQGRVLDIVNKRFQEDLDPSASLPEFIREIIYVQVIDPDIDPNEPNHIVHSFSPPLALTAQYNDLEQEGYNPEELQIGILNHEDKEHYYFDDYEPELNPSSSSGTIRIEYWTSHACWRR